ncbi:hypothetical protein B1R94_27025 [Mycolicibacterium litorale]|nr:hypothetical protein B1R94_27025 [Mycolicibacterium litorale]
MPIGPIVMSRRGMLKLSVGTAGALALAACGSGNNGASGATTLSWTTWNDHYLPEQLAAVKDQTGIAVSPALQDSDSQAYLKVKQSQGQWDTVSADALWVPKMNADGLTESFDIAEIDASKQLYAMARGLPFWKDGSKTMAYPFGWSSVQFTYDPKTVPSTPSSWEILTDPRMQGKVVAENQPIDLMAIAGLATGAKEPYNMTDDEIGRAKQFLGAAKPAFLKLVSQNDELVRALADGSAILAIANLGTDYRVKAAGGPELSVATPKEGTIGFIDGEQLVKGSPKRAEFMKFQNAMQQADWIAKNFIANGRPLFNEQAYKLLVDQGEQERADRLFYNKPEKALEMTLKGPAGNEQAYTDAFNEVFGA